MSFKFPVTAASSKHFIFICSANNLRSPTAEQVFSMWPITETDSMAFNESPDQLPSTEQIGWADIVFVMEDAHRIKLSAKYRKYLNGKRFICLDTPDKYEFMGA